MLQVKTSTSKVSFADVIGKQGDSDSDENFSTKDENESNIAMEVLIAFTVAHGAKRRKTFSALLGTGASESLLTPEFLVEMLSNRKSSAPETRKSTQRN